MLTPAICELFNGLSLTKTVGFLGGNGGAFLGGNGGGFSELCATILPSCQHNKYAYNCLKKKGNVQTTKCDINKKCNYNSLVR